MLFKVFQIVITLIRSSKTVEKLQGADKIWVNAQKDSNGVWRAFNDEPLDAFNSDWDAGEPANAAGANCAAMVKASGYNIFLLQLEVGRA
jgi:hypothetical protein